ncbi:ZRT2 [Candida pseudojiufengensis]|uniref:ZRT2 n=1 Tax=Candida pseudojiufengensis TaxID=497109 RepID=UPI0022258E4C|nr:ZRT2 [Candida pseudojiufengensis]KAI5960186.1 ZRT2 [Candida pseudojiufengensis]
MNQQLSDLFIYLNKRDECPTDNDYDGKNFGARISSIFVIMATSAIGTLFPLLSSKYSFIRLPNWCFFGAKYFGSGVIVATAFIHLLEPASDALGDECLTGVIADYPWAFGICLMTLFVLFFFELIAYQYIDRKIAKINGSSDDYEQANGHSHSHFGDESMYVKKDLKKDEIENEHDVEDEEEEDSETEYKKQQLATNGNSTNPYPKHFQHAHEHQDHELIGTPVNNKSKEQYYGQLLNVFVLEFGVIFHSVFIGLALAVSGDEFKSLYIVLVFHQMFEGLGLGTRIATTDWTGYKFTPWLLAIAYTLCTPISIAIGLGVRHSYPPGSRKSLITNGVFDSISAGILVYTGIVELMAHEFLYSGEFKGKEGFKKMLIAYFIMCWGAGLMALLGKWA